MKTLAAPILAALVLATAPLFAVPAHAVSPIETPTLERTHPDGLPPVAERLPEEPLIVDLSAKGREPGEHGGDINTVISRAK
ncbi:MAG: ABC transporter substrate-binding protein, partial [Pseudomonadota bacterium]